MNILAVGDIVGSSGVKELQKRLPKVKTEYNVDFVIVNGENAAEGMGLTEKNVSVRLTRIREKLRQYLIEREVFI